MLMVTGCEADTIGILTTSTRTGTLVDDSYYVVPDRLLEAFAPVVARLSGR